MVDANTKLASGSFSILHYRDPFFIRLKTGFIHKNRIIPSRGYAVCRFGHK
jgi:hypothetical protein